mmetsp:Transcript_11396/g.23307  ORF Transcript_11396/g.23307 Transcript_11396/m.23307 type:complete len:680 (+) Transcript_11396:257-2296(+)
MDFPYKLLAAGGSGRGRFLSLSDLFAQASSAKICYFGEFHSEDRIAALLEQLVTNLSSSSGSGNNGRLHIVSEHFSFEMNDILKQYTSTASPSGQTSSSSSSLNFDQFVAAYREIGTEGHNLDPYKPMLEYCKRNSENVQLHGGFIPRPYAAAYMKAASDEEKIQLYQTLSEEKSYLPDLATLHKVDALLGLDDDRLPPMPEDGTITSVAKPVDLYGSPGHYNLFESLMSGRDIYAADVDDCPPPEDSRRKIFQAQLIKDWAMAWRLKSIVDECPPEDIFLVLAGRAHLSHYHGVPEIYSWLQRVTDDDTRQSAANDDDKGRSELLICAQMMYECDLDERKDKENDEVAERTILESEVIRGSMFGQGAGGSFDKPVADVLYVYDEIDWSDEEDEYDSDASADDTDGAAAKKETIGAYDKVGSTAATPGNVKKARAILTYLGYTADEQEIIGDSDIFNYQGVGNPFPLASIKKGEHVIDLGSGLGIDSFLAAHYTGIEGKVLGVDISRNEVKHANARAQDRGVSSFVSFEPNDIESLKGVSSEIFDVAISNGAFCLAPNKEKAFASVYRVLKQGGRMSICTTTVREDLDVETQWPLCMRMFVHLDRIKPMCEAIGFKNVVVDVEDSELEFELEGVSEEDFNASNDKSGREKIHVGSEEFKHLDGYDMNDLCARVVVYGEK